MKRQEVEHVEAQGPEKDSEISSCNESEEDARSPFRHDPSHKNLKWQIIQLISSRHKRLTQWGITGLLKLRKRFERERLLSYIIFLNAKRNGGGWRGRFKIKRGKSCIEKKYSVGCLFVHKWIICEWTSAFIVFMSVYIAKYRTRAQELLIYIYAI